MGHLTLGIEMQHAIQVKSPMVEGVRHLILRIKSGPPLTCKSTGAA